MLTDERIEELILASGGRWHDKSFWKIEDADLHPTARAIEAEARAQDTALIRQLVEALESVDGAMPFPVARQVLKVARARLKGKP